jgi:hypothetical protein
MMTDTVAPAIGALASEDMFTRVAEGKTCAAAKAATVNGLATMCPPLKRTLRTKEPALVVT